MSETIEHAKEGIEHAEHAAHGSWFAPRVALLIAALAAALALADMGEKSAQNAFLAYHISLSNDWTFFQAKNVRAAVRATEASILESLPSAADEAVRNRIQTARENEARLRDEPGGDGMKQLQQRAEQQTELRDHAFHRYHQFELVVGALQIAIVLASVSVVTRVAALAVVGGLLGGAAALYGF
ncbi:MAG: DUF4337 family protein, partial [Alphaproteobacteria bacterium]|nr:DUF4337 family protein [Alphaproteobacteria bacterium]